MEIKDLLKNEKFLEKIATLKAPEEIQEAFKLEKIELSLGESKTILSAIENIKNGKSELSNENLSEVSGGFSSLAGYLFSRKHRKNFDSLVEEIKTRNK